MTETPISPPPEAAGGAAPAVAAPAMAPLCYVADEEPSIRHFLSLVLHGAGVDTMEFPNGAALRAAMEKRVPALVFHNISLDSADVIASLVAFGKQRHSGPVQLMSNRGAAVLAHVKGIGEQHKLNMLPVLKKPFETEAIVKILHALQLGMPAVVAARMDLDEALANKWIEFWYQPKIDLRLKRLVGAEAYARARHPQYGIVPPEAFMPGASESALTKLSELALTSVLKAGLVFSNLGINLRLAVNIPVPVLVKLPVEDVVKTHRPNTDKWAGLIIDLPEEQIISELTLAGELAKTLARCNVWLALDEFGKGHSALAGLGELPFAEVKLDRAFVIDCSIGKVNAPLCRTAIDLAHGFGRKAVAVGIEKASDAVAIVSMGCDFGQGFLLGQPMPEQRFISLLRQRAGTRGRQPVATP